jgi:hypothetical protein
MWTMARALLRVLSGLALVVAALVLADVAFFVSLKASRHTLPCGAHLAGLCALTLGVVGAFLLTGGTKVGGDKRRPSDGAGEHLGGGERDAGGSCSG